MSDVFIPVDLDKLLDDFEEQDSSSVSRQSSVIGEGLVSSKTFPISGLPTNNIDTSQLNNGREASDSARVDEANNGKLNIDLLSPDDTVGNSSLFANASLQSNGDAGHSIEQAKKGFQLNSSFGVDNLMDLTDVDVSSRSSALNEVDLLGNVEPQLDQAFSPSDITNGATDERTWTSQNCLPSNRSTTNVDLTNSLHQDLLLLDIGNPGDNVSRCNSNSARAFTNDTNDQNLLIQNKEAVKEPSAVRAKMQNPGDYVMNMSAQDSSHTGGENSLIDLTTEVTRQNLPDSLIDSVNNTAGLTIENTKENFNLYGDPKRNDFSTGAGHVERPGNDFSSENTQTTSVNQALMGQAPVLSNSFEPPTGVVRTNSSTSSSGPYNIDARTNECNRTSDDINHAAISNIPLLPDQGQSSLLFMQDHFGDSEMAGDTMDNVNTSVCVNSENYSPVTNDSEIDTDVDGMQETQDDSIPVAQDTVAEAPDEPSTNSYEILEPEQEFQLGYSAPPWLPDSNVNRCMSCQCKFTVVKRRHHCRACGKIYCSSCCNLKFNLLYLEDKLARVCQACANVLLQRQAALANQNTSDADEAAMYVYLNPNQHEPPVEPRPSHDVEDVYSQAEQPPEYEETEVLNSPPVEVASVVPVFTEDNMTESASQLVSQFRPTTCSSSSSLSSADFQVTSNVPLPPVLRKTDQGLKIDDSPNHQEILYLLKKRKETVTFLLNKNLVVKVKIVKLNCCVKRKCWCFTSEGMQAADQEDMVILLECIPKESSIPQDVLSHFNTAFAYAKQGHRVTDLGYTIFGQPFLGSLRNAGFLYIKSSFQCLGNLVLPSGPHIFGILIQREEVSWVQLFPIRLILRLGAEYRYYPSPLWSVRDREPLYGEIGHTIMDLLADFKNFQYTLPRVTGMYVHLEDKKAVIQLPQNRYDEVLKVLNATDEYVMAFEATFSNVADSHLVCIQEGTGYKTQSINLEGQERKVTGASFIVFNGALKTTNDVKAKVSVVEDGVMVQMVRQLSEEMRQAMREMSDFTIHTGCPDSDSASVQQVVFEWVSKRNPDVQSVLSPIDGLTLGTTSDIKINTHFDFSTPSIYRLRWTQLFFLERTGERPRNLPAQFKQTTADIAKACTVALRPYLYNLYLGEKHRIGLRVTLSPDMVGYIIGSQGSPLPDEMANNLDNELVPAIHNAVNPSSNTPASMEFLFNIVEMLS